MVYLLQYLIQIYDTVTLRKFSLLDIDECLASPCMHGANCINTEGSYMCQCLPGWTGAKCDVGMYI